MDFLDHCQQKRRNGVEFVEAFDHRLVAAVVRRHGVLIVTGQGSERAVTGEISVAEAVDALLWVTNNDEEPSIVGDR